jgi:hypothetical protein
MGTVSFCVGSKCCPEADFEDDGSVLICDKRPDGQHLIPFSKAQADKLADELVARGYGSGFAPEATTKPA